MDGNDERWAEFFDSVGSGRSDGRKGFDAVWVDHFWDHQIKGMVFAHDMAEAIEQGLGSDADGLPIDSLRIGDEVVEGLSGGHTVRAARVLLEIEGVLVEETIPALTWSMAVDIAEAMVEPLGEVIGIQAGSDSLVLVDRERFSDRNDIPLGWLEILSK
jgi:hypothetical protein